MMIGVGARGLPGRGSDSGMGTGTASLRVDT